MKLARLSALGFKSFHKAVDINFNSEITCIVGPNGCGKSNIIDALRWVCGESRPSILRVKDSTDLIFAGSKSMRQLGMAQVSLTIQNPHPSKVSEYFIDSDYFSSRFGNIIKGTELQITRRLFRDGEQEYLINDTQVRLKDIKDLVRYLGLTFKSCSTIAQGEIDKIVDLKPSDLKIYLEESCGLIEAQDRIKDSESKINSSYDYLNKLLEKEKNLLERYNFLKKQISKYEKAQSARRELKKLLKLKQIQIEEFIEKETSLLKNERDKLLSLKEHIETEIKYFEELRADISAKIAALESSEKNFNTNDYFNLKAHYEELSRLINQKESELVSNKTKLEEVTQNIELLRKKIDEEKTKARDLKIILSEKRLELTTIVSKINALETEIVSLVKNKNNLNRVIQENIQTQDELKKRIKKLEDSFPNLKLLQDLNLDEYLPILSLIFPGLRDIDYYAKDKEIQPGTAYLLNNNEDISTAVKRLIKLISKNDNFLRYFEEKNALIIDQFLFKPDFDSSNPIQISLDLKELRENLAKLEAKSIELEAELSSLENLVASKQKELINAQNSKEKLLGESRYLEGILDELEKNTHQKDLDLSISRAKQLETIIQNCAAEIENLRSKAFLVNNELEKIQKEFNDSQSIEEVKRKELLELQNVLSKIVEKRSQSQSIENRISELSRQIEFIQYSEVNKLEGLLSKFLLSWEDINESEIEHTDLANIDEKIERLGKESLLSQIFDESVISEFELLSEDLVKIQESIKDAEKSIQALATEISKLKTEYQTAFNDFYEKIRARFKDTLQILFPGSSGDLVSDAQGISIHVQLRNKKSLSLSQFSGGEKTLISLAFLSALAFESGSPVLLLDEVDAPLDDINVGRFINLINSLKKWTQIICVTHNKLTMYAASSLLGVTLNSDAVTEVISLDLDSLPKEVANLTN